MLSGKLPEPPSPLGPASDGGHGPRGVYVVREGSRWLGRWTVIVNWPDGQERLDALSRTYAQAVAELARISLPSYQAGMLESIYAEVLESNSL
jgi:hypothetical protein